ncbi:DUF3839 domain-containing protein [Helicobacter typhlonius]|uniref:DUF3839 domain-containing protein n=1 Tax=Helicobacter typhlonius TaxID=76936 RepID=UPI002FE27AFF
MTVIEQTNQSSSVVESSTVKSFNPNQLMIEQANRLLNLFLSDKQIRNNILSKSAKEDIERLFDLFEGNRSKYVLKIQLYNDLMDNVFNAFKAIPAINDLHSSKPSIPVFDEMKKERTDSVEIKKFIRKCNFEFMGYHCNHSTIDEKCDKIYKNITDIYKSEEYGVYKRFVSKCVSIMRCIVINDDAESYVPDDEDKEMMEYGCYTPPDTYEIWMLRIDPPVIQDVIDNIIQLNGKIAECNSKSVKTCSKCEAIKRKYEYCVRELQDMRDDLKEQTEADEAFNEQPAENKFDIDSFMTKNYPTIERFTLSDVQKKYKTTFGLFVKQDELAAMIEKTGKFRISSSKNVKYVNRK